MRLNRCLGEQALSDFSGRRRLEAILAADVVGYSRLMARAEDATVVALDAARAVFRTQIEANQGRVIDMTGDSVLAVFETAVGAVNSALAIQAQLESSGKDVPDDRRMRFRIGVHLGDVIEKPDGTVYGDGVNIAARLQTLARPGGISVSRIVQETVRDRVKANFENQGEHKVKNIPHAVHVFRVIEGATNPVVTQRYRRFFPLAAVVLALLIGAWSAGDEIASGLRAALASFAGLKAPGPQSTRTTIAVLPFANQSGDAQREYFSDGITEDVINALGRFSGVMVMSRNAVQTYKGRAVLPGEIGRELGVRYIVQGSVREAGGKLRVVVALSDADKGLQLWSERYEGEGTEVFEIQDRIARNIVGALAVKLTGIEQQRVFSTPTESLEAYDLVLRARSLLERQERRMNREARGLLERAATLAPGYGEILTASCEAEFQRAIYGWIEDALAGMRLAEEECKRVLASGDQQTHARAHAVLSGIYGHQDRFEESLRHAERAIDLNASDSTALYRRGAALLYVGRIEEAIGALETARRFDPHGVVPRLHLAIAYLIQDRYRDALEQTEVGIARAPHHVALNALRAAALAYLGKAEEAGRAAEEVRRLSPMFEVENFGTSFSKSGYSAKLQAGLRKAGL